MLQVAACHNLWRPNHYQLVRCYGHRSHNFLNQKPWHPSNFKNQARAYEAEQEAISVAKRNALAKQGELLLAGA
jgi:N-terminal domain of CBF1 interacting co-repressor CIR